MSNEDDPADPVPSAHAALSCDGDVAEEVRTALVRFVRDLRCTGADVPVNGSIVAARVLSEVGLDNRERARVGLRAALLSRFEDAEIYEPLFDRFWRNLKRTIDPEASAPPTEPRPDDPGGLEPFEEDAGREDLVADNARGNRDGLDETFSYVAEAAEATGEARETAAYSPGGKSTDVEVSPEMGAGRTAAAVERLSSALASLPGRRPEPSDAGRRPNVRRALRESIATGGVMLSVPETGPAVSGLRGVVLADVSRSVLDLLDPDFLIRFIWAIVDTWRHTRVLFFDHDIREVTDAFQAPTTAAATKLLRATEAAWGGGTRIGNAITTLRRTAPASVDRRSVVIVISDGLEMGEVAELKRGMSWLARRADTILWCNPLANSNEYEPTAAGMAAALPYVDGLFAFTGPADVTTMASELQQYEGDALVTVHGRSTLS